MIPDDVNIDGLSWTAVDDMADVLKKQKQPHCFRFLPTGGTAGIILWDGLQVSPLNFFG